MSVAGAVYAPHPGGRVSVAIVRVQTATNFERFRSLITEYEASLPLELKHSDFQRDLADLPRYYGPPNRAFIACVDGVDAGCVAFTPLDAHSVVMKKLYVRPAHRNAGIARALCRALVNAARAQGFARVVLDTDRDRLPAAYQLYRSLGFTECEPYGEVDHASPAFMQLHLHERA